MGKLNIKILYHAVFHNAVSVDPAAFDVGIIITDDKDISGIHQLPISNIRNKIRLISRHNHNAITPLMFLFFQENHCCFQQLAVRIGLDDRRHKQIYDCANGNLHHQHKNDCDFCLLAPSANQ